MTAVWRRKNVLARAIVGLRSGALADVEAAKTRRDLEQRLAKFLVARKVKHLDISELRGKNRAVTRKISRTLYGQGHAGVKFKSHLDGLACYALFETRAELKQAGDSMALTGAAAELIAVCREFGLKLA